MKIIDLTMFRGMLPRLNAKLLQPFQAADSTNADLDRGDLRPYKGTTSLTALSKPGVIQTIYRYAATSNPAEGYWFHWTTDVDVVRGPVPGDTEELTYYTGDGSPKFTYASIATSGGTGYPTNSYLMGVPAPSAGMLSVKGGTADGDATAEDSEIRSYVVTYVTDKGSEGPPSDPVIAQSILPGEYITLSGIPTGPGGNYNITTKRIYRTVTTDSSSEYQLVAELAVATDTYQDNVSSLNLGGVLPSEEWYPPPTDMVNLGVMPNGIMYGLSGNSVCFSKAFLPNAWGPLDRQALPYTPIGAGHFDNTVVVLTDKNPVLFTGTDPESMSQEELGINQACLSKRSVVNTPYGVVFASPDGLIMIGPQGYKNLTQSYFTRDQWNALDPSTIMGVFHDNRYIGFYDDGTNQKCFILDPTDSESGLRYADTHAVHAYSDAFTDELFLLIGSNVHTWNSGSNLSYTWRSKLFELTRAQTPTAARITADSYASITFNLYVDGALKHTQSVTNGNAFRMPRGYKGRLFQVEVVATDVITRIEVASSSAGLV